MFPSGGGQFFAEKDPPEVNSKAGGGIFKEKKIHRDNSTFSCPFRPVFFGGGGDSGYYGNRSLLIGHPFFVFFCIFLYFFE